VKEYEYQRNFDLENHYWWFRGVREAIKNLLFLGGLDQLGQPKWRLGKVLDLGCGTGALLDELSPLCNELWGADLSPTAIDFCRQRGHKRLLVADASRVPLPDASFDAITAVGIIEHLDDDAAFVAETRRLLKPGGVLVMLTSSFQFLWSMHDVANEHRRRYTLRQMRALMQAGGYLPERLSHFNCFLFPGIAPILVGHRLIHGLTSDQPQRILPQPPRLVNDLLARLLGVEAALIKKTTLPFGVSMVGRFRRAA
jgi:SAM-dependent methyltransferase